MEDLVLYHTEIKNILQKNKNGEFMHLTPLVFDVLCSFVNKFNEIYCKDEFVNIFNYDQQKGDVLTLTYSYILENCTEYPIKLHQYLLKYTNTEQAIDLIKTFQPKQSITRDYFIRVRDKNAPYSCLQFAMEIPSLSELEKSELQQVVLNRGDANMIILFAQKVTNVDNRQAQKVLENKFREWFKGNNCKQRVGNEIRTAYHGVCEVLGVPLSSRMDMNVEDKMQRIKKRQEAGKKTNQKTIPQEFYYQKLERLKNEKNNNTQNTSQKKPKMLEKN